MVNKDCIVCVTTRPAKSLPKAVLVFVKRSHHASKFGSNMQPAIGHGLFYTVEVPFRFASVLVKAFDLVA